MKSGRSAERIVRRRRGFPWWLYVFTTTTSDAACGGGPTTQGGRMRVRNCCLRVPAASPVRRSPLARMRPASTPALRQLEMKLPPGGRRPYMQACMMAALPRDAHRLRGAALRGRTPCDGPRLRGHHSGGGGGLHHRVKPIRDGGSSRWRWPRDPVWPLAGSASTGSTRLA